MEFKKIVNELKILSDEHVPMVEKLKSHNLPIILYGAGEMAKWVTENLSSKGIIIEGYAVDDEFFKENQKYLERPIYRLDEVSRGGG